MIHDDIERRRCDTILSGHVTRWYYARAAQSATRMIRDTKALATRPMFLRRTVTPYIGQSIIIVGVTILTVCVAQAKAQWGLLWGLALIWALFISYVYFFGMKYRVSWNEESVTMSASGGPRRSIQFDEITEVRYETASSNEFLSQARPFRRVVIFGRQRDPSARIDVSPRHFRTVDIRGLLTAIKRHRPDLELPAVP